MDEYYKHNEHKEIVRMVMSLETNSIQDTIVPHNDEIPFNTQQVISNKKQDFNIMNSGNISETPTYDSRSMCFAKWIKLLETEFVVKNITAETSKLAWLQIKLGIENLQTLPTAAPDTTYEQYKESIRSKFPAELTEQELLVQYGLFRVNFNKEGLKELYQLTLKTFRNKPEITQVAEMCSKLLLSAKTDLQRYVIGNASSLPIGQAIEQISKVLPERTRSFNPSNNSERCKFCNFPGHEEDVCQRKQKGLPKNDYFAIKQQQRRGDNYSSEKSTVKTENLQAHNLLDPEHVPQVSLIDDNTLSPGEFDDTYLETVNNVREHHEFENDLPVTCMEISSSTCYVNQAKVLLDVGANVNVINTAMAKKLQIFDSSIKKNILSCGSKTVSPIGTTVAKDIPYDMIMNIQTCGLLGISIDTSNKQIHVVDEFKLEIQQRYPLAFVNPTNLLGKCSITAPPLQFRDNEMPKLIRYGIPSHLIPEVQKEVDEMVALNICQVDFSTKYIVPLRVVNKDHRELRICQDFRELNKKIFTDFYCSPSFKELFMSMKSFSFASRIDLKKAYWQIPLHPNDVGKLGFFFNRKVYSLQRLPFGLSSSPGIFQRVIDEVMCDIPSLVYQDDILIIAGDDYDSHKEFVNQAIQRLHAHGLVINLSKSTFFDAQCVFLGYRVTPQGISPHPRLTQALSDFHTPRSPYQLRAFRGLYNFISHNIPNSAGLSIHLNEFIGKLPKSRREIAIPDPVLQDIRRMKESMSNILTLGFPDYMKDFILMCDASNVGYGSILLQSHAPISTTLNPKQIYPIAVHSRSWEALARSATPTYYELKAISRSLTFFSPLIRYCRVHIFTDHKNLISIIHEGSLPIYQKYIFNICNFNCIINYVEGHNNPAADALSRAPLNGEVNTVNCILKEGGNQIDDLFQSFHVNTGHLSLPKIKQPLMQAIVKNHPKYRNAKRILKQVSEKIFQCNVCITNNTIPRKKEKNQEYQAKKPMDLLCIDISKYLNTNILCVVDRYSKYKFYFELKDMSGENILKTIKSHILDIYGLPTRIRSDNARNLIEGPLAQYCRDQFIIQESSIRYKHTTNQIAERAFRTLFEMLRKMPKLKAPLSQQLKLAAFRINNIRNDHGITPAELFLNFLPRTSQDNKFDIKDKYKIEDMRALYELLLQLDQLPKEIVIKNYELRKSKSSPPNMSLKNDSKPVNRTTIKTKGGKYINRYEILSKSEKCVTGGTH
uniref:Reverse transcriptase n=1 Tax=Strongyloides papillosus TaxID=174720 RepID=A0A0N5BQ84_STREA